MHARRVLRRHKRLDYSNGYRLSSLCKRSSYYILSINVFKHLLSIYEQLTSPLVAICLQILDTFRYFVEGLCVTI